MLPSIPSRVGARSVLLLTLLTSLAGPACAPAGPAPVPRAPDVVVLVVDTLRADRLGCYGHGRPTSPFLDALAREGTRFADVTSQFSWTVPSLVSIVTGTYLTGKRTALAPGERTLAEAFRAAGYRTLGATSNVLVGPDTALDRGFDAFAFPDLATWDEDAALADVLDDVRAPLAEVLTEPDRPPVLLWLHTMEPHDPYRQHAELEAELPVAEGPELDPAGRHAELLARRGFAARAEGELARARLLRGRYDQEVRATDEGVRELFGELRELGLLDNGLFALLSDHGEGLWDHATPAHAVQHVGTRAESDPLTLFYQKHGSIQYQEVVRTPLILWGAGVPSGAVVASPVENLDLLPTLAELCGLATPDAVDGRSLVPLMSGAADDRELVCSHGVGTASVREVATSLKLVVSKRGAAGGEAFELYDLARDPGERRNVAGERPADLARLRTAYERWLGDHGSEEPAPWPPPLQGRLGAIGYGADDV